MGVCRVGGHWRSKIIPRKFVEVTQPNNLPRSRGCKRHLVYSALYLMEFMTAFFEFRMKPAPCKVYSSLS